MGKIVILTSQCMEYIDLIINVKNWDEKFNGIINEANKQWKESKDEFRDVIEAHLNAAGYDFEIVDDYYIIDDPAG